jgi:long-chain acyl-CoA synthetase
MRTDATGFGRWAFDQALAAGLAFQTTDKPALLTKLRYQLWNLLVMLLLKLFWLLVLRVSMV